MTFDINTINKTWNQEGKRWMEAADRQYRDTIEEIARDIYQKRHERPIVLLCGPSGSGKTTTAGMIESFLDQWGVETHTLSMDNWFCPLNEIEQQQALDGLLDLESPQRIDHDLLTGQLMDMQERKPIHLPIYHFQTCQRTFGEEAFERKEGELIILEGIHALNPDVISLNQGCWKLFICADVPFRDGTETLEGDAVRLLRRMSRDRIHRGRSILETYRLNANVRKGEKNHIFPYQPYSDVTIHSTIPYELGVYRPLLEQELAAYEEVEDLRLLRQWLMRMEPIGEEMLDPRSLIKEFVPTPTDGREK